MPYDSDLADRLRELLGAEKGLSEQQMFGGLAFLVNGKADQVGQDGTNCARSLPPKKKNKT